MPDQGTLWVAALVVLGVITSLASVGVGLCVWRLRQLTDSISLLQTAVDRVDGSLRTGAAEERSERASELALLEERLARNLASLHTQTSDGLRRTSEHVEGRLEQFRGEFFSQSQELRSHVLQTVSVLSESLISNVRDLSTIQLEQLKTMAEKVDAASALLKAGLQEISQTNTKALEEVRVTVNERLQATLETRLGESFRLVGEQLEQVHRGLGEMQQLATGVGDLKKLMSNVKIRGSFGEVQLHALLDQMLSPHQYDQNVVIRPESKEHVEFVLKIPGPRTGHGDFVLLPIDAKFPVEDYQRLVEAFEAGDLASTEDASKRLETTVKSFAKSISTKYIYPPTTTEFAIMFLPTEGLYAEIARRPGLLETLHGDHRVLVAGPSTLAALLGSFQIGFRTVALQKRSSEVWKLLGVVKTEFLKFGDLLDGVRKKLDSASQNIELVTRKSRTIERKLRGLETLSLEDSPDPALITEEY